jgi:hypothetical protein
MPTSSADEIAAAHLAAGRTREALAAIEGPARKPGAPHVVLACYGHVLSARGRRDECLAVRRQAARRFPRDAIAWHNLASALEDLGVHDEAADAGRKAFAAIDPLIRRHIAELGPGSDPVRAPRSDSHAISGSWSIRLRAGGHHVDHIHPRGWLSSAFYVEVPDEAQASATKEGWLQFGRPSLRTAQPVEPAHYVQPIPGRLVMFPSYMWHGTVPFSFPRPRMTIAFDVLPA